MLYYIILNIEHGSHDQITYILLFSVFIIYLHKNISNNKNWKLHYYKIFSKIHFDLKSVLI